MPTIENHAEHAFQLPPQGEALEGKGPLMAKPVAYQDAVTFPRAGQPDEEGNPVPSLTKISGETLARLKGHKVAAGWFKPAGGRLQLVVADKESTDSAPDADINALGANNPKGKPKA